MEMISLSASARDLKAKPGQLRRAGKVPCVVYGSVEGNLHLQCEAAALHKAFAKAGESTLVELDVNGKKVPVLFKQIDLDPITDREIHVDFYAVNMKEEIEAPVPLHFVGESPAVKGQAGVLVVARDTVRVRCLPSKLPHGIDVDISVLANFHDVVTIKDLPLPAGVIAVDDEGTVVATVQEPRQEEVITPVAAAPVEGAEGAAPAAEGAEGAAKAEAESKEKAAKDKK